MNLFRHINKFTDLYKKLETVISLFTFSFGLIVTFMTLTRVDMFMENFWIVVNLLIVFLAIFAITLYENRLKNKNIVDFFSSPLYFYLTILIQFAFGGLFATFFVFYIRSSSFSNSWFFLLILLVLLVGNEIWKKHYTRLTFQISVLFVSLYLFFVFLLPVIFHRLGADLFIASGILSLVIVFLFTLLLRKFALEKFKKHHNVLRISLVSIFVVMNVLYFTNIIPPIPLSLKEAGVYHSVTRTSNLNTGVSYLVKGEATTWRDYFTRYPVFHRRMGETVYVFSSIFSPVNFATKIVHQWQYYDEVKGKWLDSTKVTLPITGGREEGYRLYSLKQSVTPGLWRVEVMTTSGKVLGVIKFKVENVTTTPTFVTKTF